MYINSKRVKVKRFTPNILIEDITLKSYIQTNGIFDIEDMYNIEISNVHVTNIHGSNTLSFNDYITDYLGEE